MGQMQTLAKPSGTSALRTQAEGFVSAIPVVLLSVSYRSNAQLLKLFDGQSPSNSMLRLVVGTVFLLLIGFTKALAVEEIKKDNIGPWEIEATFKDNKSLCHKPQGRRRCSELPTHE